jgi:hypothetical protein
MNPNHEVTSVGGRQLPKKFKLQILRSLSQGKWVPAI